MEHAMDGLAQALDEIDFNEVSVPVYANVHATPVKMTTEIRDCLKQQLTSPVLWTSSVENMIADGADEFLEVGPKNVLTGLQKRINRAIPAKAIGTLAEVEGL
jgi:[acyl-carrier-protein] S-malonyltransferase